MSAQESGSSRLPGINARQTIACPYCRSKFSTGADLCSHVLSSHAEKHAEMKDTIHEYQGKIYELLDQNRIFNGIFVLAQSLTSETQACNVEGGCEMHQRGSNGVCIIPDNVVQGVEILHEHVSPEKRITLECRIRQLDDGATVSGLHLASDSDSMSEMYVHFGELLAT